jgi:hypothetical protein
LDVNGEVTAIASEIDSYKFTATAIYVIASPSSDLAKTQIFSDTTGVTATVTRISESTTPLSGSYRLKIPLSDSSTVYTEDIALTLYNGQITRKIYEAAPEYMGRIELKTVYKTYPSSNEGKELFYRIKDSSVDFEMVASTNDPLTGGDSSQPIEYLSNASAVASSNTPFYEVIPGSMVRTVETSPQAVVETNSIKGACPNSGICDISFIENVGVINSRTAVAPYTEIVLTGANLPVNDIRYVSVGTLRRCDLSQTDPLTASSLKCMISNMIAGSHSIVVQTTKGAIKNNGLTNLEVPIEIISINPLALHTSGGQIVTITGKYFPESLAEANSFSDFLVTFTGGKVCTVKSVTKTQIVCVSPQNLLNMNQITVAFNGKSETYSTGFSISDYSESVVSVNKVIICPVLKQDIEITLTATPSGNPLLYRGILMNGETTIYMKVNSVDTVNNKVTARFPGSPSNAQYHVYVEYNGNRYKSSQTVDAKSEINAVEITTDSPNTKSELSTTGGDEVTITGTGFSTTLSDNIVKIGDSLADVISATDTEIKLLAPANAAVTAEFFVFLKLSVESACAIPSG